MMMTKPCQSVETRAAWATGALVDLVGQDHVAFAAGKGLCWHHITSVVLLPSLATKAGLLAGQTDLGPAGIGGVWGEGHNAGTDV